MSHKRLVCRYCQKPWNETRGRYPRQACCKDCYINHEYPKRGHPPRHKQKPNIVHCFPKCGCCGLLPNSGQANQFVIWQHNKWICRVSSILKGIRFESQYKGYAPIDSRIPHSVIRKMMTEPNCVLCHQPLAWKVGRGKTPHLHHNHQTGAIYGFTHHRCNPNALEQEVDRLKERIAELESVVRG
jgi:hypothetical protein